MKPQDFSVIFSDFLSLNPYMCNSLCQTQACMGWHCGGLLPKPNQDWMQASARTNTGRTRPTQHLASSPSTSEKHSLVSAAWISQNTLHILFLQPRDSSNGYSLRYRSDSLRQVLKAGQTDDLPNLLLVAEKEVVLIDGKNLQLLWRFNTTSVLR